MISWEWGAVLIAGGFALFAVIMVIYDHVAGNSKKKAKGEKG